MLNDMPILDYNTRPKMQCFAHFPGSGPSGEICSRCSLLVPEGSKFVCSQYRTLTGRKPKPICPNSSACRYFSPRRRFNEGVA